MELSTRENLIIKQVDKGEATVICDIDEYLKEANSGLNNKEFFYELPTDPFEDHQDIIINL